MPQNHTAITLTQTLHMHTHRMHADTQSQTIASNSWSNDLSKILWLHPKEGLVTDQIQP